MKKTIPIRPAQFTQIDELAQDMLDTVEKGKRYVEAISPIMAKYFKPDTLQPGAEFQHRYGNDIGYLETVACTILAVRKKPEPDAAFIMEDVKTLSQWKEEISTSGELKPVAAKRSIKALENLIDDNKSRFSPKEKDILKENIAGLKQIVRTIEKHVKMAQELCEAIMPGDKKRG